MDIFFTAAYAPFSAALIGFLAIAVIELAGMLLAGAGLSDLSELLVDTDSLPESAVTNWLLLKQLPLSVVLALLFFFFGATGWGVQHASELVNRGEPLPLWVAVPMAVAGMALGTGLVGRLLRPLFATHTTAVFSTELVGRQALLLSPRAAQGFAGEAKLTDQFGQTHYVMVEPESGCELKEGERLVLVRQSGAGFVARRADEA